MWKKILTISLVLAMVLSLVACVQLPPAQEIVDGVIESLQDTRTYQFDMDMTMDIVAEVEGETDEMTVVMSGSGALDLENRQMMMDTTTSIAMPGLEMEMGMELYLIGDMMYMLIESPLWGATWSKLEMPEGTWEEMNQVEPQIELLEVAQVEVIGSERVGGVDCYVLDITPDMEQLWQMVMQQAELTGEPMPDVAEEFIQEMFRSFSVKQWVAKDTYFLAKVELDIAVELTPEAMGFPEEEGVMTMDIAISLLAYDYNQPVSIELPPEAEEAIDIQAELEAEAAAAELATVQTAMDVMMVDQGIYEVTAVLEANATNDMSTYPTDYPLYPDYLWTSTTTGTYYWDETGLVSQKTTGYE
jgi:hypothetical protein